MAEDLDPIKQIIQIEVKESGVDETEKKVGSLNKSIDETTTSNRDVTKSFDEVYKGMKPLTTRMGEAEDRLYELALAGQTAGQEYKDLLASVANYRKTQIETDRVVDAAATTLGQKLGGAAQIAATGVQGVTAGMALFGDQSEDTEKALLKVQSAMAFADAISNISTLGGQWRILKSSILESSIATKANTAATGLAAMVQKLFTGSVAVTTTGFKALKFAIAATGIGLLVVGIGLVVSNFDKLKATVLNLVPGLASVGKIIGNIVNAVTDFVGATSEADRAVERMKSNADASLALNKKFLAEHGDQLNEFTKQKIEAKDRYNEAIKEDGADQIALAQRLNRELAAIEYSRGDEQRKIQASNIDKANAEAEKRRLKAIDDKKVKDQKDEADRVQKAKEDAQRLYDTDQEAIAAALDIEEKANERKEEKAQKEAEEGAFEMALIKFNYEKSISDQKAADQSLVDQKKRNNEDILATGEALITGAKMLAGKNKALQKSTIIAEGAMSLGKVGVNIATGVSKDAASGAVASIPQIIKTVATGVISTASIISNTSRALKAVGGGAGGGGGDAGSVLPTRNVAQVGFQGSSESQISTAIAQKNKEQPPIQAFVVSQSMTDQQELDRKRQLNNSF